MLWKWAFRIEISRSLWRHAILLSQMKFASINNRVLMMSVAAQWPDRAQFHLVTVRLCANQIEPITYIPIRNDP